MKEAKPLRLPINEAGDLKDFDLVQLYSLHESRKLKKLFHLHPELVHEESNDQGSKEFTICCHRCCEWLDENKKGKAKEEFPPNSIAAGVDFGDPRRLGLATPTMPELVLLVKVQHFHDVVKVQGNHKPGGDQISIKIRSEGTALHSDMMRQWSQQSPCRSMTSQANVKHPSLLSLLDQMER